jgi:hypothetical protein
LDSGRRHREPDPRPARQPGIPALRPPHLKSSGEVSMRDITFIGGSISAISFLLSGVCWITAASVKHPNFIDLGVIGDPTEPKDWFWAYRRANTWNSRAAWCAAVGAIFACVVQVVEVFCG